MNVIKQEGVLSLNHGLTAAVLRQLTYSTTRFAIYEVSICIAITEISSVLGDDYNAHIFEQGFQHGTYSLQCT
jgi:hypothetical protein